MPPDLLLHPKTRQAVTQTVQAPTHALLVLGPDGIGKGSIARHIAARLLDCDVTTGTASPLTAHPAYRLVAVPKDSSTIGIDAIRAVQQFVKLRPAGKTARRVIHIEGAQALSAEAQNALLKILEEPPAGVHIIMTASSEQAVLPTVRSRSQLLTVHVPALTEAAVFFGAAWDQAVVTRVLALSGGLPGLAQALLSDESHPLALAVDSARNLLKASPFERLCKVDTMAKQKGETLHTLRMLQNMARTAMQRAAIGESGSGPAIRQWQRVRQAAYDAERSLESSVQAKLVLANFMLAF